MLAHHTRLLTRARESGALVMIVYALTRRAFGDVATGDWAALAAGAAEALDLAGSSGQPALTRFPHGWLALLAALRDQRAQVAEHLQAIAALPSVGVTGPVRRPRRRRRGATSPRHSGQGAGAAAPLACDYCDGRCCACGNRLLADASPPATSGYRFHPDHERRP